MNWERRSDEITPSLFGENDLANMENFWKLQIIKFCRSADTVVSAEAAAGTADTPRKTILDTAEVMNDRLKPRGNGI